MRRILLILILLHVLVAAKPLGLELKRTVRDMRVLKGKDNNERLRLMLGGVLDSVEDHEFISRCAREIPPDADVLVVTNVMTNVYTLSYYLYPRKVYSSEAGPDNQYWIVHYFTPKALGLNKLEGPVRLDNT